MPHKPEHPDNPYRPDFQEAEHVPAKVWELLRRNEKFRRALDKLRRLDDEAKTAGVGGQAWLSARALVAKLKQHHDFAGHALEWLIPEPWFEVRHLALATSVDLAAKTWAPTKSLKIEGGRTPNPKEWITYLAKGEFDAERVRSIAGGVPMVRGPRIITHTSTDSRLHVDDKVDAIQEWRNYHASHGPFTLADNWRNAPPGFKRVFCWLWRNRDSRERNPLTGCRTDVPQEHETDFFQNWRLMEALQRAALTGQLTPDDSVRSLTFDEMAKDYRLFAIPRTIRSRTDASRLGAWLVKQLSFNSDGTALPKREKEVFGTSLLWDMLLFYFERRQRGDGHEAALCFTFDLLYLRLPQIRQQAAKPRVQSIEVAVPHLLAKRVLSEAQSTRWHSWLDDFARMYSRESGKGLVQLIFPSFKDAISASLSPSSS